MSGLPDEAVERKPAAIHIRARDLRVGDVIIGEGRVLSVDTYSNGDMGVFFARQSYTQQTYRPSAIVLVEVGPDA